MRAVAAGQVAGAYALPGPVGVPQYGQYPVAIGAELFEPHAALYGHTGGGEVVV